jgi:hypothetical protein
MANKNFSPIVSKNLNLKTITHGFFTKKGGFSRNSNSSLNCSYNSNDSKINVYNNRELVCNYHKLKIQNLKTISQVHGNKVLIINNLEQKTSNVEADAMVTNKPNIILGILTADCAPVLALDPINRIVAAIHIGWKGAIKNILSNTIDIFIDMGSDVKNIDIAIGPCIGPKSYEVEEDFYNKFTNTNKHNNKYFVKFNNIKYKFNLPKYIKDEALNIGIREKNIAYINKDTFFEDNIFFSYRRNHIKKIGNCGRMISTISINEK